MIPLSDTALRHLQRTLDLPDAGPRYALREELGRGGMGVVYRAHDRSLGRDVALKVLAFDGDTPSVAHRLAREAHVLARLEHPGIVAVHDAGTTADGRPFYVMRHVRGTTLAALLGRGGPPGATRLPRGDLLRLFLQLCDAIAFAHARGVIHRDLTPGNVMVGEFGEVLVVDWGVARLLGHDDPAEAPPDDGVASDECAGTTPARPAVTGTPSSHGRTGDGMVLGTPGYMPPEQAAGAARDADARADVYGLGAILRDVAAHAGDDVPRPLAAIVARATAADPAQRYPDVTTLAADVRRWLDAEPVDAYRESAAERTMRFYRRNRPLIWLLLTYAVVRTTILLWRGV